MNESAATTNGLYKGFLCKASRRISLEGKTLAVSQLGPRMGLIGIQEGECKPPPNRELTLGCRLLILGTERQR